LCATPAHGAQSATAASIAFHRARTALFSACPQSVCNKRIDSAGCFPLAWKQMQSLRQHGHHHHHGTSMPADCDGLT
ncbi:MAG: hypothetical protein WBE72_01540, partial [Terracidiphilus sp.]